MARRTAEDRQPKYLRIHAELRDRITSGQWPAGTSLPAQRDLAAEFGVSIMTLRQALQLLADDGLIAARHGSGTYVAARYEYDLGHLRSFAADLAAQGAEIRTRLLAAEVITPADEVSARLGDPAQVLRLRRLRLAGGRPHHADLLPAAAPGGRPRPGRPGPARPVHGAGRARAGRHRAAETISPCLLGTLEAGYLERPAGSPALLSHRVSFTADGLAVVDDHAVPRRQRRDHRQPVHRAWTSTTACIPVPPRIPAPEPPAAGRVTPGPG